MDKDLLSFTQESLTMGAILLNLGVGVVLGLLLQFHFKKFGATFSSKEQLGRMLPFLVLIVCLIISIVKSSLALSLGLVGALSIVRFRTAIKDPEELVYLFMAIAIGLGLGANQTTLTIVASLAILAIVAVLRIRKIRDAGRTAYLHVSAPGRLDKEAVSRAIKENSVACELKKAVEGAERSLLIYTVRLANEKALYATVDAVKSIVTGAEVSFVDQSEALAA